MTATFRLCAIMGVCAYAFIIALLFVYPPVEPGQPLWQLPPALSLQFAQSRGDILAIFGQPGTAKRASVQAAMHTGNLVDYGFMLVYGIFLSLFFYAKSKVSQTRAWWVAGSLIFLVVLFDVLENGVLERINANPDSIELGAQLVELRFFAWGKWSMLAIISTLAGLAFFLRGAYGFCAGCMLPILMVLPAYGSTEWMTTALVLTLGVSWAIILVHACKRGFFRPET